MRVLVFSSTFPNESQPTRGVFVRERIRRLAKRCELIVVAPIPWFPFNGRIRKDRATVPLVEKQEGLTVHHPRFFSLPRYGKCLDGLLYCLSLIAFTRRLRRTFPFEVIDAHFAYPDGVGAALLAKLFRCPVVVTLRGSIVRLSGYRLHRPQLRWVLRRADAVTAVSESLARLATQLGLPPDRVRVIPNGVDAGAFLPIERVQARRLAGLPEDRTILLTVAGVYEGKGQHLVIEALPSLLDRHPDLLYVLVGSPRPGEKYRRRLRASAARLGVSDRVYFAGPRPHAEVARWFSAANATVLATRSEGWPNVLLESLACGTPVVATRVGGTPEIVREGQDGFLVPYGDGPALVQALHEVLDAEWSQAAIARRARAFDWTDTVEQALDSLTQALKRPA